MNEIWKTWKDTTIDKIGRRNRHGGLYEVSNFGRCRLNGEIIELKDIKIPYYKWNGYLVHRLVAMLFLDNPDNKRYVDHIDGDTHNNRADNLRWVTNSENMNNPITKERSKVAHNKLEYIQLIKERLKDYYQTEAGLEKRKRSSERMKKMNTERTPWNKDIKNDKL